MSGEPREYVTIYLNEDGDRASVEQMSGSELRKRLKEQYWGARVRFADSGPSRVETEYFVGLIVIRGQVVEPRPVQVATEYDL